MIACERCHTENLEGSQYCDECGASLLEAKSAGQSPPPTMNARLEPDGAKSTESASPSSEGELAPAESGLESQVVRAARTSVSADAPSRRLSKSGVEKGAPGGRDEEAPHAKLVIYRGRSVGKEFPLNEDESHIGRWDADGGIFPDVDLDADDPEAKVSRRHARITKRGEHYYIEDLGSTNGTFVNRGRRLLPGDRQTLHDGDEVIVGKTFLRFHVLK